MAKESTALTIDQYGTVRWLDGPPKVDPGYIKEVPQIHELSSQPILDSVTKSQLNKLFQIEPPMAWAHFTPYEGYFTGLCRTFFRGQLLELDVEDSLDKLDAQADDSSDEEESEEESEEDALFTLLYQIRELSALLKEIELKIISMAKP